VRQFNAKNVRLLGTALAMASAGLCGSASAQTVSDQLQVVVAGTTHTYTAYEPTSGFESILAYGIVTGGMDDSSNVTSIFVSGTGATAWPESR
jgi:hypothetical protein